MERSTPPALNYAARAATQAELTPSRDYSIRSGSTVSLVMATCLWDTRMTSPSAACSPDPLGRQTRCPDLWVLSLARRPFAIDRVAVRERLGRGRQSVAGLRRRLRRRMTADAALGRAAYLREPPRRVARCGGADDRYTLPQDPRQRLRARLANRVRGSLLHLPRAHAAPRRTWGVRAAQCPVRVLTAASAGGASRAGNGRFSRTCEVRAWRRFRGGPRPDHRPA